MLSFFHHHRFRSQVLCLVVGALLVDGTLPNCHGLSSAAERTQTVASEYDLKLVRLYATSKFIAWPDEAVKTSDPFVIGVIDPDPFQGGLQKLAKRRLKDRPIKILLIKSEQDYQPCHLLFIPKEAKSELVDEVLKRTANQPVLIWRDESDPKYTTGVSCTFVREGEALLIEADPAELLRRKLNPDGQLLSLNLVRVRKSGK